MRTLLVCALALLTGCQTMPAQKQIPIAEFERLGFKPEKNKVSVIRIIRPGCAYCEIDLRRLANLIDSGFVDAEKITLFIAGAEDGARFRDFQTELLKTYHLPKSTQIKFVDLPQSIKEEVNQIPFGFLYDRDKNPIERGPIGPTQKQIRETYKNLAHLTHGEN